MSGPDEEPVPLARAVAAGDAAAEARLLGLYGERVRLFVRSRVRDPEAARDLAQEVWIAVLAELRRGALRDQERLGGFVHGVARNVVNGHFRRRGREPEALPVPDELAGPPAADPVEAAERKEQVRRWLRVLDPIDRRILELTLNDGQEPAEIAAGLGLSGEAVRTRKSRALRALAERAKNLSRR